MYLSATLHTEKIPINQWLFESLMYLLKRALILDAFGSNKHPAVSERQLLCHCAPELLKQFPRLVIHSVRGYSDVYKKIEVG